MSGEPAVAIPRPLLEQVFHEARRAFPLECCGWLAGERGGAGVTDMRACANQQAGGQHPTAPDRGSETAYVIAGDDLLALVRGLDSGWPPRVIYHSHPNGRAYLSDTDRQVATSPWGDGPAYPVQQLVVGIDERQVVEAALFAWGEEAGTFVEVARFPGADI
jgi:[CysO sulfur-carrier protein]-S-L-cysteine hydrolase